MDIKKYMAIENEKPLDNIVQDGGFCKIFKKMACVGDSLAAGEFESTNNKSGYGFHDFYEYSWGQHMANEAGIEVLNFSRGGMTAKEFRETYGAMKGYWEEDKACQAYVLALGVNDILNKNMELGSIEDISRENMYNNKDTFAGNYALIIQRYQSKQPDAKFFLVTMPKDENEEKNKKKEAHAKLLHEIAALLDNTYVIDLYEYAPVYDKEFKRNFYLGGHMNAAGYVVTAKMIMSYIDYIVRHNPEDFAQVAFIGKPYHNFNAKW